MSPKPVPAPPSRNPYAAPTSILTRASDLPSSPLELDTGGAWRKGRLLVMHRTAQLPDRCIKSNDVADRRVTRKLWWHHPAVYLGILINLLVYIILALCLRKQATVEVGLSERWFQKWRQTRAIAWGGFGVSLVVMLASAFNGRPDFAGFGLLGMLVAAIYGGFCGRLIAVQRIDDDFVWIRGARREFLEELPEFPGPQRALSEI